MAEPEIKITKEIESYIWRDSDGKIHRNEAEGPAIIKEYKTESLVYHYWYCHGKLFRANGPSKVTYFSDGPLRAEEYYNDKGLYNPDDGSPARTLYYKYTGTVCVEDRLNDKGELIEKKRYYSDGTPWEEHFYDVKDGISEVHYWDNGQPDVVLRKMNGKSSDYCGMPAICFYTKSGELEKFIHKKEGLLHCDYEPAQWSKGKTKEYWINGKQVSKKTLSRWKKYINAEK